MSEPLAFNMQTTSGMDARLPTRLPDTTYDAARISRAQLDAVNVLVVGDVMLDRYWFGAVNRISPEAPVPVVHVKRCEECLGGAANVASNITALGAQASLVCVLGDDEPAQRLLELLHVNRVRAYPEHDANLATTIKLRVISRQQQLLRIDFENTPDHELLLSGLERFKTLLPKHDVVLFSDYAKGGLVHITAMIAEARAAGKFILVDPKGPNWEQYRGATLITPNRAELAQVVGQWNSEDDLEARVTALRNTLEIDSLLLTRSEEGMSLYSAQGSVHIPTNVREVFDVSGAGDTVIATLATLLGAGMPLLDAMTHANRAAGIAVGKLGVAVVKYEELFTSST